MSARGTGRRRLFVAIALGLVALGAAVYLPVAGHPFVGFDDDFVIVGNPGLRLGFGAAGLRWALTTGYAGNWTPLTWLSLMLDYRLHGLSPTGYHLENVALHVASALLLFAFLLRTTGALWRSAAAAAVFTVHPLHVEAVAWAASRKDVLSGLCFFLALLAHARYAARPGAGRYLALLAACALGLAAKPMLVTLPGVLLLVDLWPLGRLRWPGGPDATGAARGFADVGWGRAALEKLPVLGLAAVSALATWLAQSDAAATVPLARLPLGPRVENALVSVLRYVSQALWPSGLAVYYPHPEGGIPPALAGAAGLAVAAATLGALLALRRRPWLGVGWLWFLGMLVPVSGLVQVGSQAMADRYAYLPLVGLSLIPVWGLPEVFARLRLPRPSLPALASVWLALLTVAAAAQVRTWRDSETLFEHALAVTGPNPVVEAHLGAALLAEGHLDEGTRHLRAAVRLRPDWSDALNDLAWTLATHPELPREDPAEPVRLAAHAAQLTGWSDPRVLDTLAAAQAAAGRLDDAEATTRRALPLARAQRRSELASSLERRLIEIQTQRTGGGAAGAETGRGESAR